MNIREPGRSINWRDLTSGEAAAMWAELVEWVTWLHNRYHLSQAELPTCWWRHGAAVEELTALFTGWEAAYHAEGGDGGAAPAAWHVALDQMLHRFTGCWFAVCGAGECGVRHTAGRWPETIPAELAPRTPPCYRA